MAVNRRRASEIKTRENIPADTQPPTPNTPPRGDILNAVQASLFRTLNGHRAKRLKADSPSDIHPSLRIHADLRVDPLDIVEAVMDAEDAVNAERRGNERRVPSDAEDRLLDPAVDFTVGELSDRLRQLLA